jgi:WD40 repeat protein
MRFSGAVPRIDPEDKSFNEFATIGEAVYRVTVWDSATRKVLRQYALPLWGPIIPSADGKTLAAVNAGTLTLFDTATGKTRKTAPVEFSPTELALSPDSTVLAALGSEGQVALYQLRSRQRRIVLAKSSDASGSHRQLAFSADGRQIALALGRRIRIWEVSTGKELTHDSGPGDALQSLAISLDGKTVTALGEDRTLTRWDRASGRQVARLSLSRDADVHGAVFSPDGRVLLAK